MHEKRKIREERTAAASPTSPSADLVPPANKDGVMTATQACMNIYREAHALYGLAARGEGSHYPERDGYNLYTYNLSDLILWDGDRRWTAGCTDVKNLPEAITSIRNVEHWSCVNESVDSERVFLSGPLHDFSAEDAGLVVAERNSNGRTQCQTGLLRQHAVWVTSQFSSWLSLIK